MYACEMHTNRLSVLYLFQYCSGFSTLELCLTKCFDNCQGFVWDVVVIVYTGADTWSKE